MKINNLFSTIALLFFGAIGVFAQPFANAGADKVLYLPYSSVVINGAATPEDDVDAVKWELVSATGTLTMGSPNGMSLVLSNCTQGVCIPLYGKHRRGKPLRFNDPYGNQYCRSSTSTYRSWPIEGDAI